MGMKDFRPGLFRHFKGAVYFADGLIKDHETQWCVRYCNALNPTVWYARPLEEWDTDVTDRIGKDNVTGQTHRFERVSSFSPTARDLSTDELVRELAQREDSPIHGLDLDCLMSAVTCVDYCVGVFVQGTQDFASGVSPVAVFGTEEEAFRSSSFRNVPKTNVYKRTFIKVG